MTVNFVSNYSRDALVSIESVHLQDMINSCPQIDVFWRDILTLYIRSKNEAVSAIDIDLLRKL